MKPDMTVSWDDHLKRENIWRVEVELAMQDEIGPGVPSGTYILWKFM